LTLFDTRLLGSLRFRQVSPHMDSTLLAFLQTTDADERERLLSKLILEQAAPSVRQVLRYRLRFHISKGGTSPANPDAEDLYHDVITKLVKVLNEFHAQRKNAGVGDFRQYATRVAVNACNDYLRSKYPSRARLKDNIRDTLERHPGFDIWRSEQGEMMCGFVAWRNEMKQGSFHKRAKRLEEQPEIIRQERFARIDSPLTKVIAGIFEWVSYPVELESLVSATAVLLDILTGMEDLPVSTRRLVKETLSSGEMRRPAILDDLAVEKSGATRSNATDRPSFKLTSPGQAVIVENKPVFKWEALNGALGYKVYIASRANWAGASSPTLAPSTLEWTPPTPLRRGETYTWVVSAITEKGELTVPASSEPERKFKVLSERDFGALMRLKQQTGSRLALGLFYARSGLVFEAEKELQLLANENAGSSFAAKLLDQVRSWR